MDTLAGSPFGLVQRAARFFAFFTLFFPRSDDFSFKSLICKVLSFEKFLCNEISWIYLGKVWWNSSWRLVRIFIRIFRFFGFYDCTISLWNLRFLTREEFLLNQLFGFHLEKFLWNNSWVLLEIFIRIVRFLDLWNFIVSFRYLRSGRFPKFPKFLKIYTKGNFDRIILIMQYENKRDNKNARPP